MCFIDWLFIKIVIFNMVQLLCFHLKQHWAMYMLRPIRKSFLTQMKFLVFENKLCHCSRHSVDSVGISYHAETINGRKYRDKNQTNQMILSKINHILKSNEYSYKVNGNHGRNSVNVVSRFDSNILPSNTPSEDRRSAATCLQSRGMLFGVFDGHAGYACAQAVSERLFYYIAVALLPVKTLADIEDAVENERPVLPMLQWHKHPNDHSSTESGKLYFNSLRTYWQEIIDLEEDANEARDVEAALINAFKRLDNDISVEAQVDFGESTSHFNPLKVALSGCTACVVHVDGNDLHVANLGDSRAVLGVQEENGTWSAHTISYDHNAQNSDELQRVLSEHPLLERKTVVKHDRLLGQLIPFRGFGDMGFKWSGEMLNRVYETKHDILSANEFAKRLPPNYLTPPYLIAQPEVTHHSLRPKDKFLILATDGLWELMHRQTVVQVIGEHLTGLHWQKPLFGHSLTLGQMLRLLQERKSRAISDFEDENCATHLVRYALGSDGFGTVEPWRLSKMLSVPQDLARMYRDDITIVVIHFNCA
ncbi:pyruvate dehydrogenase [acetyl-transferring]-phosphatase 1, mitochondrial [Esox lucius]|uniref:[Pyruvate dehydrogenase [acetyl-transferring]]-phosphatase 2, mitochondrial n=1 Tax=Esox lucius TaxID=8010 RepID=A0A3P9AH22_ESOLU|nr:pyruvate dehydrogenase [acetyl-transferring]-phosphatase 1, mitochondrial [Esox lucius]XP_028969513.2 pyruvate dehydrogenase [acetyl-transferring]-phosphatase 1, mitochondrial [Esox lucius]XP_028969514.2 pyruvate dehydrogenase [acetyl-transferring]-phosphatase 1, mitochondrial [Esox lucius]